ncbi:MAG: NAD(+) synthase [Mediterranea massiliensis]|nr:NAD(+) synthase [Mediterranea massiliensis]
MNYGFVKVAAAIPHVKVADCKFNVQEIEKLMYMAEKEGVQIAVFPEFSVTGYTCGDLFGQQQLLAMAEKELNELLFNTRQLDVISIVGMPLLYSNMLLNVAVVIQKGDILGVVPKTFIPSHQEFAEKRWFTSANDLCVGEVEICGKSVQIGNNLLFSIPGALFGIEIAEDLWAPIPPSSLLTLHGADLIFNLSADSESLGKHQYLRSLMAQQSARCIAGYVYSSCGFGESTTDMVFAGDGFIYENGNLLAEGKRFSLEKQLIISEIDVESLRIGRRHNSLYTPSNSDFLCRIIPAHQVVSKKMKLTRSYSALPFVPENSFLNERCEEVFSTQILGLAQRLLHTQSKTAVIGISGGLDSTLALLVCAKTFDKLGWSRKGIIGVTMPGFGTTDRTYTNALNLMKELDITVREISIKEACLQHFKDIGHNPNVHDVVYENSQARERTQILMDIANQTWGMVIGTGDLSELALGWATYNGDHMSMYGVNAGVPKTLVRYLVKWVAENEMEGMARATLLDIVDTPISPELIPADENGNIKQVTEDLVGPYELHDFFLYYFLRHAYRPSKIYFLAKHAFCGIYDDDVIKKWMQNFFRRFFNQQFKRSCLPDGPKIGSVSISPRGGWCMPSDASSAMWIAEVESL